MRIGIKGLLGASGLLLSSLVAASTWVPIYYNGIQFLVPKPSIKAVHHQSFYYSEAPSVYVDGFGQSSALYYQVSRWESNTWQAGVWSCISAANLSSSNFQLTLPTQTFGRYRVSTSASLSGGCDLANFSPNTKLNSEIVHSAPFFVLGMDNLDGVDTQNNPISSLAQATDAKGDVIYDLLMHWPMIEGISHVELTLFKDEVPFTISVPYSEYLQSIATEGKYRLTDTYAPQNPAHSNQGFLPYFGAGDYRYQIKYCADTACSAALKSNSTIAVKPKRPTFMELASHDVVPSIPVGMAQIDWIADKRTPFYNLHEGLVDGGTTTLSRRLSGFTDNEFDAVGGSVVDEGNGNKRFSYRIQKTQSGHYFYNVFACNANCSTVSKANANGTTNNRLHLIYNDYVVSGQVDPYEGGTKRISGWAYDGDGTTKVYLYHNGVQKAGPFIANQLYAQRGDNTGFVIESIDQLLSDIDFSQPVTLDIRAEDIGASSNIPQPITSITLRNLNNLSPTAVADTALVNVGQTHLINVLANDSDPEGQVLTPTISSQITSDNGTLAVLPNGMLELNVAASPTDSTFSAQYYVSDSQGGQSSPVTIQFKVDNFNAAPHLSPLGTIVMNEDTAKLVELVLHDSNTPMYQLNVTASASNSALFASGGLYVSGVGANRTLNLRPLPNKFGNSDITVVVSDGEKSSSRTFNVTVHPKNDAPIANNDSFKVGTSEQQLDVLANDTDIEGDPLRISGISAQPANGIVRVTPLYVFYTPNADFSGIDEFRYIATDGKGTQSEAIVLVQTAASDLLVAYDDQALINLKTQTSVVIDVLANDVNADSANVELTLISDGAQTQNIAFSEINSFASAGTWLAQAWNAATGDSTTSTGHSRGEITADRKVVFTPGELLEEDDIACLEYRITDGITQQSSEAKACVTPKVIPVSDTYVVEPDTSKLMNLLENDGVTSYIRADVFIVEAPSHGSLVINDSTAGSTGGGAGSVTYQPDSGYFGTDSFKYAVRVNGGLPGSSANVEIWVGNAEPTAEIPVDDHFSAATNKAKYFKLLDNDSIDKEGVYRPLITTQPQNGTIEVIAGATENNIRKDYIRYTPNTNYKGSDTFTYAIVQDGFRPSETEASVSINVADKVPHDFSSEQQPLSTSRLTLPANGVGAGVATIAGEFRVSESGAATYQVGLTLPTGAAGVKPSLSVSYNSQSTSSSILGTGWSLSAASSIARCPKSRFYDDLDDVGGYVKGVVRDETDALCLDGMRMIRVAANTYRLLNDDFSVITSIYGSDTAAGPIGFERKTKSGDTHYYGNTGSSADRTDAIISSSDVNLRWVRSRVSDTYSNHIDYYFDQAGNEFYPSQIKYSVNTIDFVYEDAPTANHIHGYWDTAPLHLTKRLKTIEVKSNSNTFRDYKFTYQSSAFGDELAQIDECVGSYCAKPVNFEWERPTQEIASNSSSLSFSDTGHWAKYAKVGDFNGDGVSDMLTMSFNDASNQTTFKLQFTDSSASDVTYAVSLPHVTTGDDFDFGLLRAQLMQVTTSGRPSLVFPLKVPNDGFQFYRLDFTPDDATTACIRADSSDCEDATFTGAFSLTPMGDEYQEYYLPTFSFGDVNGDGLTDLLFQQSYYYLNTGGDFSSQQKDMLGQSVDDRAAVEAQGLIALNRVLCKTESGADCITAGMVSKWTYKREVFNSFPAKTYQQFDINGDGRSDYYGRLHARININPSDPVLGEYDSDADGVIGRSFDIIGITIGETLSLKLLEFSGNYPGYSSNSADYNKPESSNTFLAPKATLLADINGDGLTDVFYHTYDVENPDGGTPNIRNGKWAVALSYGEGLLPKEQIDLNNSILAGDLLYGQHVMLNDYDQDGKSDLLIQDWTKPVANGCGYWFGAKFVTDSNMHVELVKDESFFTCAGILEKDDQIQFGDFDGDGVRDMARFVQSSGFLPTTSSWEVFTQNTANNAGLTHRIKRFEDSLGNQTDVTYAPMSDASVYTPGSKVAHPLMNQKSGISLVASVASDDGLGQGDKLSIGYKYQGARMDGSGRGTLGFEALQTIDSRFDTYDMVTTTYYEQGIDPNAATPSVLTNPHVIGSPLRTVKERVNRASGVREILADSTNEYTVLETEVREAGQSVRFNPVSVYLSKTTEVNKDLVTSATAPLGSSVVTLSNTVTTTQQDIWGNVLTTSAVITDTSGKEYKTETINWYGESTNGIGEPAECTSAITNSSSFAQMLRYGRLSCSKVTKTAPDTLTPGVKSASRFAAFAYNAQGILLTEVAAAGSEREIATSYEFDGFGNRTKTITTSKDFDFATKAYSGVLTRESTNAFDADGRFPISQSNALGHTKCLVYDDTFGVPLQEISNVTSCSNTAGGFTTNYRYNALGQVIAKRDSSGVVTLTSSQWCNSTSKANCSIAGIDEQWAYKKVSQKEGAPISTVYFDVMGREFVKSTQGFAANTEIFTYTKHNRFGQPLATFAPSSSLSSFLNESANKQAVIEYDILGRAVRAVTPTFNGNTLTTETAYSGLTVTASETGFNGEGQTTTRTKTSISNANGETIQIKDTLDQTMTYHYNVYGKSVAIVDNQGNSMRSTFNNEGERLSLNDPDKGEWIYRYNGFGQLVYQKDANGDETRVYFDDLGREIRKVVGANRATAETTCTYYDDQYQSLVDRITHAKGTIDCDTGTISQQIVTTYDEFGRIYETTTTINDTVDARSVNETFFTRNYYDELSRIEISQTDYDVANRISMNTRGYVESSTLLTVNNNGAVQRKTIREALEVNDWGKAVKVRLLGQVTQNIGYDPFTGLQTTLNSGVTGADGAINYSFDFDDFGSLTARTINGLDAATQHEKYNYDALSRLTDYKVNSQAVSYYCYDSLGNMTVKGTGAKNCSSADYSYGNSSKSNVGNAGAHAVLSIASRGLSFNYDNNGSALTDGVRSFTYNHISKPTQITKPNVQQINFAYGFGGSRYLRLDKSLAPTPDESLGDNEDRLTLYHGAMEKVTTLTGDNLGTKRRISMGSVVFTLHDDTGVLDSHILVKDHQGSTIAIANQLGVAERRYRFDPFGQQREIATGFLAATAVKGYLPVTQRGYTGHEMLPNLDVIHMNGRIYDPTIARFLQADPMVQAPTNLQNLNRYSYVLNNPMSYTDPSGYFFKALNRALGKFAPLVSIALSIWLPGASMWGELANSFTAVVATGFVSGGIATGSLKGALNGALSAAIFFKIGDAFSKTNCPTCYAKGASKLTTLAKFEKVAVHAIAGGVMSVINGGKFGNGFIAAGVTQALAPSIDGLDTDTRVSGLRMTVSAVIGGTVSYLTGGKFVNGALTGAFSRGFNDEMHFKTTNDIIKMIEENLDEMIETVNEQIDELAKELDQNLDDFKAQVKDSLNQLTQTVKKHYLDIVGGDTLGIIVGASMSSGVSYSVDYTFAVDSTGFHLSRSDSYGAGVDLGIAINQKGFLYNGSREGLLGFGGSFNLSAAMGLGFEYETLFSGGSVGHAFGLAEGAQLKLSASFGFTRRIFNFEF